MLPYLYEEFNQPSIPSTRAELYQNDPFGIRTSCEPSDNWQNLKKYCKFSNSPVSLRGDRGKSQGILQILLVS
jgi:hypothetical protein